jgi:hypothetical protein
MEMLKMNGSKQVRTIFAILKDGTHGQYKDSEILEYANLLHEIFTEEQEDAGFLYRPYYDDYRPRDVYSVISSSSGAVMYEEINVMGAVYDLEADEFIRDCLKKYNLEDSYDC